MSVRGRLLWALWVSVPFITCCLSTVGVLGWAVYHAFGFMELEAACKGVPVEGGAPIGPDGPERAVVLLPLDEGGWQAEIGMLPDEMAARYAHDVQVVVCAEAEREVVVEECAPGVRRVVRRRFVRIVEVRTAAVVATGEIAGDAPPPCSSSLRGDLVGGAVGSTEIAAFVGSHLAAPTEAE